MPTPCEGLFSTYIGSMSDLYETVAESPTPTYCAKASHAQLPDIPIRSDTLFPSPYRKYSSYSAEGKVPFP